MPRPRLNPDDDDSEIPTEPLKKAESRLERRAFDAQESLTERLLELAEKMDRGHVLTEEEISYVTVRKNLELLAKPDLGEAFQLKALEQLTGMRVKKLVQKALSEGSAPDAPARSRLALPE